MVGMVIVGVNAVEITRMINVDAIPDGHVIPDVDGLMDIHRPAEVMTADIAAAAIDRRPLFYRPLLHRALLHRARFRWPRRDGPGRGRLTNGWGRARNGRRMKSRRGRPAAAGGGMIESLSHDGGRTGDQQGQHGGKQRESIFRERLHNRRLRVNYFFADNGISFTFRALWGIVKVKSASGRLGFTCQSLSVASY